MGEPAKDSIVEAVALVILNSDRQAAGFPPVESRDGVPDSDGYVRNALAVIPLLQSSARSLEATDLLNLKLGNALNDCRAMIQYHLKPGKCVKIGGRMVSARQVYLNACDVLEEANS